MRPIFVGNAVRRRKPVVRRSGFTLMEVLIVMTILGILAAIAIPNYSEYIQRGHRSDAKALLLQAAQWQERIRTETNAYANALPAGLTAVPATGTARYNVSVAIAGGGYTLTAAPTGASTGDPCGSFTLTGTGVRGLTGATRTVAECWGR